MDAPQTAATIDMREELLGSAPIAHIPQRTDAALMPEEPVSLSDLGMAAGGFVALAAAVALGCGEISAALRVLPSLAGSILGAALLTTPGLVVAHQMLGASGPLAPLVSGVARGLCRAGALAWGLVPLAAYFSVTAPGSWPMLLGGLGLSIGLAALLSAGAFVSGVVSGPVAEKLRWRSLVMAWIVLTAVIGARLAALGL